MSLPESRLSGILTDRYRIERELGQGGMATVYLAHDLKLDREVALKVLRPELGAVLGSERFLAEIKITARLDHPHILTLIDSGAADGLLYYVLPFVRGESLRDLLNREKQLGLEQALAITKQVGSALDYAHRKGVVHRDIKPENILLQEGEAMLADFGIALAVKEAGGNRLTETGLSLGTPQYMSPEQATGDRTLDARSDVYSLGAVLYEMLTGEPPMTGATVQAVIAKLLTEQPTRIRIVRSTVPEGVDEAVARALAKVPADRFPSAGEFVAALGQPRTTASIPAAEAPRSKMVTRIAIAAGLAVVGILAAFALSKRPAPETTAAALRDRTQLTFTGAISTPALSADGKQLAYFVKVCGAGPVACAYAIEVQDVGNPTSRRIVEGATAAYGLEWSPDRRNLIMFGTVGGRYGSHLVSALGGPPRHLTAGAATFFAGGDSLLIGSSGPDSVFTVRVASLGGAVRDSIRIPGPGNSLASLSVMPGTSRIIALVIQSPRGLWQIVDRSGKVTDRLLNTCTCGAAASRDAIWMTRAGPTAAEAVVRVAIDSATGKFAARQDTVYSGQFSGLSVTADGTQMAVDDGSYTFTATAAGVPDLIRGKIPPGPPLAQGSSRVGVTVSPDGGRLLFQRAVPNANGQREVHLSIAPFPGGTETPVNLAGNLQAAGWIDSVTLKVNSLTSTGRRLVLVDPLTGTTRNPIDLDSTDGNANPLPAGWVWIPKSGDRVVVQDGGNRREITKDRWFSNLVAVKPVRDGSRLAVLGWGATDDRVRFAVVPTAGGPATPWFTSFAESAEADWLDDGSLLISIWDAEESASLFRVRAPGQVEKLGRIPYPVRGLSVSKNLARAAFFSRQYRGDAWLYRVVTR